MAKVKKTSKRTKRDVPQDFISQQRRVLKRRHRRVVLFNDKEAIAFDNYCSKYGIKSKSAFIRNVVISHILVSMDENYPRLF